MSVGKISHQMNVMHVCFKPNAFENVVRVNSDLFKTKNRLAVQHTLVLARDKWNCCCCNFTTHFTCSEPTSIWFAANVYFANLVGEWSGFAHFSEQFCHFDPPSERNVCLFQSKCIRERCSGFSKLFKTKNRFAAQHTLVLAGTLLRN